MLLFAEALNLVTLLIIQTLILLGKNIGRRLALLTKIIYWYHVLYRITSLKYSLTPDMHICQREFSCWKYSLESFLWDGPHCNRRRFLLLKCSLKTTSFENILTGHIVLPQYTCYNMLNISVGSFSKRWQRLIFTRSSETNSVSDGCEE